MSGKLFNGGMHFKEYLGSPVDFTLAPWEKGFPGKGILLNGNLYAWRSHHGDPDPHHDGVYEYATMRDVDKGYYEAPKINILPDGTIDHLRMGAGTGQGFKSIRNQGVEDQIAQYHPDFKTKEDPEAWHFGAADPTPPGFTPWDGKSWGKALVTADGQSYTWQTAGGFDGSPAHAQAMQALGIDADNGVARFGEYSPEADGWQWWTLTPNGNATLLGETGHDEWHFGSYQEPLHDLSYPEELDPWRPGQLGKGLVSPEGQAYAWIIDSNHGNDGYPSHEQALDALGFGGNRTFERAKGDGWSFHQVYPDGDFERIVGPSEHDDIMRAHMPQQPHCPSCGTPVQTDDEGEFDCPQCRWRGVSRVGRDPEEEGEWRFGAVPAPGTPVPDEPQQDRGELWKAITTVDGQHHVFFGAESKGGDSHLGYMHRNGITPEQVTTYWAWNPYADRWEDMNRFTQDYKDSYNALDETDGWNFGAPTMARSASLPPLLYHWTEASNAPWIHDYGLNTDGVYLTQDDKADELNPDIPDLDIPFRVTVDTGQLDPSRFGVDNGQGYPGSVDHNLDAHGNLYYTGPIPRNAIIDMQKFKREPAFAL